MYPFLLDFPVYLTIGFQSFSMSFWIALVFVMIFPFLSLILFIWVFSQLLLVRLAKDLSILCIFSKNQHFVSLSLWLFFSFHFINLCLMFYYFQFWGWLALVFFFKSLRCNLRVFICDLFFMQMLKVIKFPLSSAFAVSQRFW
jgi:hypothetical protein